MPSISLSQGIGNVGRVRIYHVSQVSYIIDMFYRYMYILYGSRLNCLNVSECQILKLKIKRVFNW